MYLPKPLKKVLPDSGKTIEPSMRLRFLESTLNS